MLKITDLKKGTIFAIDNEPFKVIDYNQKVMGRGGSIVSVRIKSLLNGKVLDKTFKGNSQIDSADINNIKVQYLYSDENNFYFMNPDNFEQYDIPAELVGSDRYFLKENDVISLQTYNANPIGIELPKNTNLLVVYTEDAVKGDTSSSVTKDAKLETGLTLRVPAFIKNGDIISVDTANKTYRERVK